MPPLIAAPQRPVIPTGPIGAPIANRVATPPTGPANFQQVQAGRVVRADGAGRRITTEPGDRRIIRQNNTTVIQANQKTVINAYYPQARTVPLPSGLQQTFYTRPDGYRVYTEVDRNGGLVRRYGVPPRGGPQVVYVDNRRFYRNLALGVGIGVGVGVAALVLSQPIHALPRERYIVESDDAPDEVIYEAMMAPPVARLERAYSLDEVRYSSTLRDYMPRVDLDTLTFEFGSVEVTPDQYRKLERIARGMAQAIERNPGEVFMIEGHTDAVGSEDDNLSLSDRRAEAIQRVLVEVYAIPLENLVTQGYGKQQLKVRTDEPERANRRVTVRRITPLLKGQG